MTATGSGSALLPALAIMAAAATAGIAMLHRDPDPPPAPEMAERPFLMPDGRVLRVQKFEVTVAEWSRCHAAGACALEVKARPGFDPQRTPATGLSHVDVEEYLAWIGKTTGRPYRLPSLAEWEAMAREVLPEAPEPLFTDPALTWASAYLVKNLPPRTLRPSGSFSMTSAGIADLDGSVWEWTSDCYNGANPAGCAAFWAGGEHFAAIPFLVRDPARGGCAVGAPPAHLGFRLVADIPPSG